MFCRLEEADPDLLFGGLFKGAAGEFDTAGADTKSIFLTDLMEKTVCRLVLPGNDPEHSTRVIERLAVNLQESAR